jgi:aarF domain-containing kinase
MSLARNLVDLYILASGVTKVGTSVIASQSSAICLHVKTSSLLNPTPITKEHAAQSQAESQQPTAQAIEVPFPEFAEKESANIKQNSTLTNQSIDNIPNVKDTPVVTPPSPSPVVMSPIAETLAKEPVSRKTEPIITTPESNTLPKVDISSEATVQDILKEVEQVVTESKRRELKESRIPTSRFGRLWNYGTLATGMGMGAINESFKRATGLSQESSGNKLLTNIDVQQFFLIQS